MNKNRIYIKLSRKYSTATHRLYRYIGCILWIIFFLISSNALADDKKHDLAGASLEELLNFELITASKIARQVSDAPSAVSIVTADDIKAYGYRTLGEILNSMRGLNITYDRAYDFLGGRGFSSPGEYSGRIMLLIDGMQANDNVYNQAYFDHSGLIDTELIERVEYVPGPGSVAYGNNAFFGIVNIITKKGADFNGAQAAVSAGSFLTGKTRLTFGKQFSNDVDLLLSASGLTSRGQNFYFPEFDNGDPLNNNGIARRQDGQNNQRFFAKLQGRNWLFEAGHSRRHKDIPTAPYGADFNTHYFYTDTNKFVAGQYHIDLSDHLKLSLLTDFSDYRYHGNSLYSGEYWADESIGRRWGTEAKFSGNWFDFHKIIFGVAFRDDFQRKIITPAASSDHGRQTISVYAQNEFTLRNNLWLNLGVRNDYFTDDGNAISPRFALIYEPLPEHFVRLSYSRAHRTPTAFEKFYTDGEFLLPNPNLKIEHVHAAELVLERRWGNQSRVLASFYHQTTVKPIQTTPYSSDFVQYLNTNGARARGIEIEAEHHWRNNMRVRASYAFQDSEDGAGNWAINSPRHLGKFNFTAPIYGDLFRTGVELQVVSRRKTHLGNTTGGFAIANATLNTNRLIPNLDISFTIRNLFNTNYVHVAPDYNMPLSTIAQDSRNYWLQLTYEFK